MMKVRLLGTGTSNGVPAIGCTCPICTSADPRDRRLRSSLLIETDTMRLVIDCGPDFRQQMLQVPFKAIDGVLLTHEHYDHVGGLDDLRPFCTFGPVNIYGLQRTLDNIRERMPYAFADPDKPRVPHFDLHTVTPGQSFTIYKAKPHYQPMFDNEGEQEALQARRSYTETSLQVLPLTIMHGKMPILGYRIGTLAYITDMKSMPEANYDQLSRLDMLIINGLRHKFHPTHQTIEEAIQVIDRLHPREARIIHLAHSAGLHADSELSLPDHVRFAYDGEELTLPDA